MIYKLTLIPYYNKHHPTCIITINIGEWGGQPIQLYIYHSIQHLYYYLLPLYMYMMEVNVFHTKLTCTLLSQFNSIQFIQITSDRSLRSLVCHVTITYTRQDEHIHTVFTAIYKSTYIKYIYRYEYNNLDPPLDMLKHSIIIFISVWQNTYQTVSASGKLKLSS